MKITLKERCKNIHDCDQYYAGRQSLLICMFKFGHVMWWSDRMRESFYQDWEPIYIRAALLANHNHTKESGNERD